jgi:hypothetical protein
VLECVRRGKPSRINLKGGIGQVFDMDTMESGKMD